MSKLLEQKLKQKQKDFDHWSDSMLELVSQQDEQEAIDLLVSPKYNFNESE